MTESMQDFIAVIILAFVLTMINSCDALFDDPNVVFGRESTCTTAQ